MKQKSIKLSKETLIPQIGFGTWQIEHEKAEAIITNALDIGYIHIDTAQIYNNEYEVGLVIKDKPRKDLFITTKVWMHNFKDFKVFAQSVEQSLKRLNTEYVDLLLLHWPVKQDDLYLKAYKHLEKIKAMGLTKEIGVSNYNIAQLQEILKIAQIKPTINQIEYNPINQQKELVLFCQANGIAIEGYTLLKPYLGTSNRHNFTDAEKGIINQIASTHQATGAQVILKWALQNGIIIFPKSSNKERMKQNLDLDFLTLSNQEMNMINDLDRNEVQKNRWWEEDFSNKDPLLFEKHF